MASDQSAIPMIDFDQFSIDLPEDTADQQDVDRIAAEIIEAFSTVGFVYLKNTGISEQEVSCFKAIFIT